MGRLEAFLDHLFTQQRWVIHLVFWLFVLALYVTFFGRQDSNYLQTFFFVGLLMPVTIGTTYFVNYYLVPQYLMKERYGSFLLYFVYTLIGSLFLEGWIAVFTFILIAEIRIKDMNPASFHISFLLAALLMVVFLAVAIKMLLHWRKSKEDYQKLMRAKVETELKFLKLQLNPHFLFNTLNNLYYLASEKSDKAPGAILALSELLDYILRETKVEFVPLERELNLEQNYIELESLRYDDRLKVNLEVSGEVSEFKIAPMLLLTLVENAFKHGVMKVVGNNWIRIGVNCSAEKIELSVSNSYRKRNEFMNNGIGLENLKNQLAILYTDRHSLNLQEDATAFSVNLVLTDKN